MKKIRVFYTVKKEIVLTAPKNLESFLFQDPANPKFSLCGELADQADEFFLKNIPEINEASQVYYWEEERN